MRDVYNILNNQDKVTMKNICHIICDLGLDKSFCTMWCIPCACTRCVEQFSKPCLPNFDKTPQPCYVIEPETCE